MCVNIIEIQECNFKKGLLFYNILLFWIIYEFTSEENFNGKNTIKIK